MPRKAVKIINTLFFSGVGTKEMQKVKGGELILAERFRKCCDGRQYLIGTWSYSSSTTMSF